MKRNKVLVTLAALALALPVAAAAGVARERNAPSVDEHALKGHEALGEHTPTPDNTVSYTDTNAGGPTYNRVLSGCGGLSGVGTAVNYHTKTFTVSSAGSYDITSVQDYDGFITLYQNSFDPSNALTNCVNANDDGSGGIGTSEILGQALSNGVTYIVVTTAFSNGTTGTFTNTLTGPGTIVLGGQGPDLAITKAAPEGVAESGPFVYAITATNDGPGDETGVVVSDSLPASLVYVSDDCGGGAAGQDWTWNVGSLTDGASASCNLTVQMATPGCVQVDNTATIDGDGDDGNPGNNSSTASNGGAGIVADGSFEGGSPNADWTEFSTNFGTPLCTIAGCGTGTGTGPRTGDWWAWFGGIATFEQGTVTQAITIPAGGSATLSFWTEAFVCSGNAADFLEATVDGSQVFLMTGTDASCGTFGYSPQNVDVSAWADGGSHTLAFNSIVNNPGQGDQNFFVDDVDIVAAASCVAGGGPVSNVLEIPTLGSFGFAALAGFLALAGLLLLRRRTA